MKSNISFNSNIYPVVDNLTTDRQFLSKIIDYNRLKALSTRVYIANAWSEHQERIIKELPYCELNPNDPCWGMTQENGEYIWECKCTKSDCKYFERCRKGKELTEEEIELFSPVNPACDEFGYESFIQNYHAYPVLSANLEDEEEISNIETRIISPSADFKAVFSALAKDSVKTPSPVDNPIEKDIPASEDVSFDDYQEQTKPQEKPTGSQNKENNTRKEAIQQKLPNATVPSSELFTKNIFSEFKSAEQEEIICSDSSKSFFVDAGPGTGKTYTLINKLNYMVTNLGVNPEGILVLCFTNAAVNEIKRRLKKFIADGGDRGLANVDIRTFHSFSWWLINQANELFTEEGWRKISFGDLSYDSSLIEATGIMRRFGDTIVESWEYFIVDEVQDLTNSLGYFVLQIVKSCINNGCGVTVFGDACQAIYDYTLDNDPNPLSSEQFYRKLFVEMYGKSDCLMLTENHRQNGSLLNNTNDFRKAILSNDFAKMKKEVGTLNSLYDSTERLPSASIQQNIDTCLKNGNVCLLFRNNATTLKMSSDFRKLNIDHTLNIVETNKNYARWISDVLGKYDMKTIDYSTFESRFNDSNSDLNARDVWNRLLALLHTRDEVIDVRSLLDAISVSKIDDPYLRDNHESSVIVSNIHRSKGREFDSVILEKSFVDGLESGNVGLGEYKTFYVSITRARSNLYFSPLKCKTYFQKREIFATGRTRWVATSKKKVSYFEFNSEKDLDINSFARIDEDRFDGIKIGDEIILKREISGNRINYSIVHDDMTFGFIGNSYIEDIKAYMQIDNNNLISMPSEIGDLYVSGVYSMVVDADYLKANPEVAKHCKNGVWKWIDIVGIGHLTYDVY